MPEEANETKNLEEEIFKTLSHQLRRDILRVIGESQKAKFTEIKKATRIDESASLSYHLNALAPLLLHKDDTYSLSELGKDAYSLMNKMTAYSASAATLSIINRQLGATIIANALLWAAAILAVHVLEGPLNLMTLLIFAMLFSVSNNILYSVAIRAKPSKRKS